MLSPDELKKVKVFKDTYNAMYLKGISDEKIEEIKSTSNPVQRILINNLKKITDPDHPYNIEFIEGPIGVRKFKLEDSMKTIYIFGEIHRKTAGHCNSPKAIEFHDYLYRLSRDSPAFFDVYVEVPMVKEKKNSPISSLLAMQLAISDMFNNSDMSFSDAYNFQQNSKLSPITTGYMFRKISEKLRKCTQPELRMDATECKLLRFHNVDVRSTWDIKNVNPQLLFKEDIAFYILFTIFSKQADRKSPLDYINVIRRVITDCPSLLKSLEIIVAKDTMNLLDIFNSNKSLKKELDASYKKKEIEIWLIKMTNHILIENGLNAKTFINIIKNLISSVKTNTHFKFFQINSKLALIFLFLNNLLLDTYCLSRIFKVHNLKKHISSGEFQPEESKNIIIYAGDNHSDNMVQFFYSIGFKPTYSYYNPRFDNESCVNMKKPNTFTYKNPVFGPLKTPLKTIIKSPINKSPASLKKSTVVQLRLIAKKLGCKGYLKLNKNDLIALIVKTKHQVDVQPPSPPRAPSPQRVPSPQRAPSPQRVPSPQRAPSVQPPSCNVTDSQCKKLKKDELVQLALKCKVVETKSKGTSMNKNQLCELLKKT